MHCNKMDVESLALFQTKQDQLLEQMSLLKGQLSNISDMDGRVILDGVPDNAYWWYLTLAM